LIQQKEQLKRIMSSTNNKKTFAKTSGPYLIDMRDIFPPNEEGWLSIDHHAFVKLVNAKYA